MLISIGAEGGLLQFSGVKEGLISNLRKTPRGISLDIFSSTVNTIEIILSQKLNFECSKRVKYKRISRSGGLETTPFRVVWL